MEKIPANVLRAATVALLVMSALVIVVGYPSIPDPMPVHYAGADPSTVQDRSWWSALFLPVLGGVALVLSVLLCTDARRSTDPQPVRDGRGVAVPYSPAMARRQREQIKAVNLGWSWLALGFAVGVAYAGPVAVLPALAPASRLSLPVIVVATFLGLLKMLNLVVATGRRVRAEAEPDLEEVQRAEALGEEKKVFRLGAFYYNRLDPMPIVKARRQPDAMEFNYAHGPGRRFLWSLLAVFVVVATVVVIPTFTTM